MPKNLTRKGSLFFFLTLKGGSQYPIARISFVEGGLGGEDGTPCPTARSSSFTGINSHGLPSTPNTERPRSL